MGEENGDNVGLLYEEAKGVVDKQLSRTETIESRAGRILRVTMLTVGVILTALSIGIRWTRNSQQSLTQISNDGAAVYFVGALFAIGGAAIFSAMAYTAAPIRFGPSGRDIRRLFENEDENATRKELLAGYSLWSDINRKPLEKSRFWITSSMACIALSPIYIGVGLVTSFTPIVRSVIAHSLVALLIAGAIGKVMGVRSTYQSYRWAKHQAHEAQEDFWKIMEERQIEHVLEGASFGGEKEENQSPLRRMVLGEALENWIAHHLDEIVPNFDRIIQENREPGMMNDDFTVAQEDGTRVAVEAKTGVDARTAEEILNNPSSSADPQIDLYVVSFEFTESGRRTLAERDYIHMVEVDKERVKSFEEKE
jgi:hypothetical protein